MSGETGCTMKTGKRMRKPINPLTHFSVGKNVTGEFPWKPQAQVAGEKGVKHHSPY
jgi:hypothetical protein